MVDSDEVNAFALPGGFLFVNLGLILKAENEAELASVMAHEIAHVAARHATRQATRSTILNYATIPLVFIGGWTGYAIRQAAGVAIPLGFLNFSRRFEREADFFGLQYVHKAGCDPTAFVDFFEKIETLEKRKPGTISRAFATHPMAQDRVRAAQKEIQRILKPKPAYVLNTSDFETIKARLQAREDLRRSGRDWNRPVLPRRPDRKRGPGIDPEERPRLKRRKPGP